MPILGENIGRAYVEVVASGDGLDESIRREFHDSEPTVREGGRMHGQVYGEEFDRAVQHSFEEQQQKTFGEMGDDLTRNLRQALQRVEVGRVFFESDEWKKFRGQLEHEFGDAGALAGRDLEKGFADNFDINRLTDRINNIGPDIRDAQARILNGMRDDALRMNREFDQALSNQQSRLKRLFDEYVQELERMERGEKGVSHTRQSLIADFERLRGLFQSMGPSMSHLVDNFDDVHNRITRLDDRSRRWGSTLRSVAGDVDTFGEKIGRLFGAGSRNNFLNFIGSSIGNLISLTSILPRAGAAIADFAGRASAAFSEGGFIGVFSSIGPLAAQGAAGLAALVVAVGALIVILGPLISLLSLLLGALIALASTVILGAVAGLAALGGAAAVAVVGIATLVAAIATASKNGGVWASTLKTLKSDLSDLGAQARSGAFINIGNQMQRLHDIFRSLGPLVHAAGVGMSHLFDGLLGGLQSRGFREFEHTFTQAIPGLLGQMGRILGNVFSGIGSTLAALIPLVREFLGWLAGVTSTWADWSASRAGQEAIRGFLRGAVESAKSLGGFLKESFGLLTDLIGAGASDGNRMFDSLTEKVKEFRDLIAAPPPRVVASAGRPDPTGDLAKTPAVLPSLGKSPLEKWFKDAHELANNLGDAAVNLGKLLDELDNPEARSNLNTFIDAFNDLSNAISDIPEISGIFSPLAALGEVIAAVSGPLGRLKEAIIWLNHTDLASALDVSNWPSAIERVVGKVIGVFQGLPGHISDIFRNWTSGPHFPGAQIITGFAGIGPKIIKKIGKVDISGMISGGAREAGKLVGNFAGMAGKVFNKVKTNVSGMISGTASAVSHLISGFTGTAARVFAKVKTNVSGMIDGAGTAVSHLVSSFAGVSGRVLSNVRTNVSNMISGAADAASRLVDAFRGLAGRIVAAIGTIVPHIEIHMPHIPGTAVGGIFDRPQFRQIAEAGAEAVVPLNRPLSMVDPAVRELSAFAQGKRPQSSGIGGKTVTNNFHVTTPTTDPHAVAVETVNYLTAVGGY